MSSHLCLIDEILPHFQPIVDTNPNPLDGLADAVCRRTYFRTYNLDNPSDIEDWPHFVQRLVLSAKYQFNIPMTKDQEIQLYDLIYNKKLTPAGRFLWQMGTTTVDKCGMASLHNCAAIKITSDRPIRVFTWTFHALLCGVGVGYNLEKENFDDYPIPKYITIKRKDSNDADFIIPDSREGWVSFLKQLLQYHFLPNEVDTEFTYACHLVRPKGTPIKGFGGVAAGPDGLDKGIQQINGILNRLAKVNKRVTSIDALDIMNNIAEIVASAGIRGSAQVAIGSCNDFEFLTAKRWDFSQINNDLLLLSGLYHVIGDIDEFIDFLMHRFDIDMWEHTCYLFKNHYEINQQIQIIHEEEKSFKQLLERMENQFIESDDEDNEMFIENGAVPQMILELRKHHDSFQQRITDKISNYIKENRSDVQKSFTDKVKELSQNNETLFRLLFTLIKKHQIPNTKCLIYHQWNEDSKKVEEYNIDIQTMTFSDWQNFINFIKFIPYWRVRSNNTVVCSDIDQLPDLFWEGYHGNGEPYGLANLELCRSVGRIGDTSRANPNIIGLNPCCEQPLEDTETCVLQSLVLPNIKDEEELFLCAKWCYLIGKHSMLFHHSLKETEEIVHKNFRIGISITGICQLNQEEWFPKLDRCYNRLRKFDEEYSKQMKLPISVGLTTVKPEGTTSKINGTTPGCHPGYAQFYIQRIRFALPSKQVDLYIKLGYRHCHDRDFSGKEKKNVMIIEFPVKYEKGTILAKDVTAIDQLEMIKNLQKYWSDNAISCTVYYRMEELETIKEWLRENYTDCIKSVSFLLHSDHGFDLAPYEEITEEEYNKMKEEIKPVPMYYKDKYKEKSAYAEGEFVPDDACPINGCPAR